MFRKLRLFYYNNKEKVWATIGMIIFVIAIIQILNNIIKTKNEKEFSNMNQSISNQRNETTLPSGTSGIISDSTVSESKLKEDTEIIEAFVNFGNTNNVEGAYNLLSQDCKNEMFQTIDRFYEFYFKDVFSEKRSYNLETWTNTSSRVTYRIKYLNDIMATGTVNDEFIEDYITVIKENDESKLNINEFINKISMEKKAKIEDLEAVVTAKYNYYDYVEYDIMFTNTSEEKIILDSKENTGSVYIQDERGVNYEWFGNELSDEELNIEGKERKTLRIKFNKLYNQNRVDNKIKFTNIIIAGEKKELEINL